MTNSTANAVAQAVFSACKRQVEKNRSLDNLNLDRIVEMALSESANHAEVLPGATKEEIASVMMQDIVGEYDVPEEVPEWAWVEREASFNHSRNGQDGIWEFVLNLSRTFKDVPVKLKSTIEEARCANMAYLIFHQGT